MSAFHVEQLSVSRHETILVPYITSDEIVSDKIVIPSQSNDKDDIITYLQDILSNLNYSTHECICCGWIEHEENNWKRCSDCDEYICANCYSEHGQEADEITCEGCS